MVYYSTSYVNQYKEYHAERLPSIFSRTPCYNYKN